MPWPIAHSPPMPSPCTTRPAKNAPADGRQPADERPERIDQHRPGQHAPLAEPIGQRARHQPADARGAQPRAQQPPLGRVRQMEIAGDASPSGTRAGPGRRSRRSSPGRRRRRSRPETAGRRHGHLSRTPRLSCTSRRRSKCGQISYIYYDRASMPLQLARRSPSRPASARCCSSSPSSSGSAALGCCATSAPRAPRTRRLPAPIAAAAPRWPRGRPRGRGRRVRGAGAARRRPPLRHRRQHARALGVPARCRTGSVAPASARPGDVLFFDTRATDATPTATTRPTTPASSRASSPTGASSSSRRAAAMFGAASSIPSTRRCDATRAARSRTASCAPSPSTIRPTRATSPARCSAASPAPTERLSVRAANLVVGASPTKLAPRTGARRDSRGDRAGATVAHQRAQEVRMIPAATPHVPIAPRWRRRFPARSAGSPSRPRRPCSTPATPAASKRRRWCRRRRSGRRSRRS